jgi:hypothetical protein
MGLQRAVKSKISTDGDLVNVVIYNLAIVIPYPVPSLCFVLASLFYTPPIQNSELSI